MTRVGIALLKTIVTDITHASDGWEAPFRHTIYLSKYTLKQFTHDDNVAGQEAVKKVCVKDPPDVVLMDCHMPVMVSACAYGPPMELKYSCIVFI